MRNILVLEELGQLILSIFLFSQLEYAWWMYLVLIWAPNISMLGYLWITKIGAICYNLFHHKLLGTLLFLLGYFINIPILSLSGIILFGHAAMDRVFGYGLKYEDDFKHTHLVWIGEK